MLAGNCESISLPSSLAGNYLIKTFMDRDAEINYCALVEVLDSNSDGRVDKGWGTFIINPNPERELGIHITEPLAATGIEQFGVQVFKQVRGRYFLLAGTHPEANDNSANSCQSSLPSSDVVHNNNTMFHQTIEVAKPHFQANSNFAAIQFNQKDLSECSDTDVFLTNGSSSPADNSDKLIMLRTQLQTNNQGWTVTIPGDSPGCNLDGADNIQGRLFNNVASNNVCNDAATTTSGQFFHIELSSSRQTAGDWISSIASTWSLAVANPYMLRLHKGWNLISVPLFPDDKADSLFNAFQVGKLWRFMNNQYNQSVNLSPKNGYWLYSMTDTDMNGIAVNGSESLTVQISEAELHTGWNLIGPVTAPSFDNNAIINFTAILPVDSFLEPIWEWDGNKFVVAAHFKLGRGYWVFKK